MAIRLGWQARGDLDVLGAGLETCLGEVAWEQLGEPTVDALVSKIVRNWLEDVEWYSLSEFVRHIADREPLVWRCVGPRAYAAAEGSVQVSYCRDGKRGRRWRLLDERGMGAAGDASTAAVSFHPTLATAQHRARCSMWQRPRPDDS
ncbi:hypothetical protein [Nonomuraea sp. NPDC050202]|jgi:hypothetical protein|uniref:hypothetical protein n=1 Tax=Nonomuraea sp. NPDC050202 TaxID=3155035 RepID=UPI0033EB457F